MQNLESSVYMHPQAGPPRASTGPGANTCPGPSKFLSTRNLSTFFASQLANFLLPPPERQVKGGVSDQRILDIFPGRLSVTLFTPWFWTPSRGGGRAGIFSEFFSYLTFTPSPGRQVQEFRISRFSEMFSLVPHFVSPCPGRQVEGIGLEDFQIFFASTAFTPSPGCQVDGRSRTGGFSENVWTTYPAAIVMRCDSSDILVFT